MRRRPDGLSFEDIGRAARALARLPDTRDGALPALGWASINLWRAVSEDRDDRFPLSLTVEWALQLWCAETPLSERTHTRDMWRALSAIATALAADGNDPSRGAIQFHHGRAAPDWALTKDGAHWIGAWAFYGSVEVPQKLEARGVSSAGFPP